MRSSIAMIGWMVLTACSAVGCRSAMTHNLPPAQQHMEPGPGVAGPGPAVMMGSSPAPLLMSPGMAEPPATQIVFTGPAGMSIAWDVSGHGLFDSDPLITPGRQNFPQGAIYRLKLENIPGRAGVELYPTLEVGPTTTRTDAYLAHSPVPINFSEEDWDQVLSGNYVTKVVYLPDPEFQDIALADVATLVSTRLDPGVDPIVEADRRGSILAIIRMGNKDLELPGFAGGYDGQVMPVSYNEAGMPINPAPLGAATAAFVPPAQTPDMVSGVTTPQWGMPMSGTPIGLAGPPHIPLGGPAGLQKHVMTNHTVVRMPEPVDKFKVDVKQRPGMSYPEPVDHVSIKEQVKSPGPIFWNPLSNLLEVVK